jgi:4-aminobutyrate aminotransferase-like enzyme
MSATDDLIARRDRLFGTGAPLFYDHPVHLVRGEGVWLFDADGRRYLDVYNNVPVVGHCNPRVVEAMARQASMHTTHSRYISGLVLDYADRVIDLHHEQIESIVFTCTGTEANEVAMLMARAATGGRGFICTDGAYHGNSALVGSLTRGPLRGRPDVHAVPFPQRYRPLVEGVDDAALCDAYLSEVDRAITDFARAGVPFAGLIVCSILANEGLPDVPTGFLPRAAEMVRAAGGVVIMDEVQAGFCRSGHWWGYELMGVVPDIVTMGKPMGNGLPLAACAARRDLVDAFRAKSRYFNTFAASPLQAAVGGAVLDELESRDLLSSVESVGGRLRDRLRVMAEGVEQIGDVRGSGLFIGIDWVTDRDSRTPDPDGAARVANRLRDRGVLLSNAGLHRNVLKVRPPLVFDDEHADMFVEAFVDVLSGING